MLTALGFKAVQVVEREKSLGSHAAMYVLELATVYRKRLSNVDSSKIGAKSMLALYCPKFSMQFCGAFRHLEVSEH